MGVKSRRLVTDYDLQQPWLEDKQIVDDKKLYLGTDKDYSLRYDSTNDQWILRDEVNGVDILAIGRNGLIATIGNLADDLKLFFGTDKDYSVRYDSTNDRLAIRDEVNGTEYVFPRSISRDIGLMGDLFDSGDKSCAIGTGGTATRTTLITLATGLRTIPPLAVYMEVGGTVASGETVSISVKAILDDGTELEIASYSTTGATGSSTVGADTITANLLTNARAATVSLNGRRITSIVADVSSSATTTSATATVRVFGMGL